MKYRLALFLIPSLIAAQGIDSIISLPGPAPFVAADPQGNILALRMVSVSGNCPACVGPPVRLAWAVYRYDPSGQFLQAMDGIDQVVDAAASIAFLAVDSHGSVYVGGNSSSGGAFLQRASDPGPPWNNQLTGKATILQAIAFDPQDNPIVLGSDAIGTAVFHVMKVDRTSGQILADFHPLPGTFPGVPAAIATDPTGAVYIASTLVSGFLPRGQVTKTDAALAKVIYSTPLNGIADTIAVSADGSVYVGGSPSAFLERLNPDGTVGQYATTQGIPAVLASQANVTSVKLDSAGNVIATGLAAPSTLCGPDRQQLALAAIKMDPALSQVLASGAIPQRVENGPMALLPDGSLYLSVSPRNTAISNAEINGITARVLHVDVNAPASPVTCIVNGASFLAEDAMAPGQLLTIFGRGLGNDPLVGFDSSQQLPSSAAGTEVRVNGVAAPLLAVSSGQINAIVPYGLSGGGPVPIEIHHNGNIIYTWQMQLTPENPAPLLLYDSTGTLYWDTDVAPAVVPLALALNADGTLNGADHPAQAGSVVTIFATGFGQLTPAQSDGAPGDGVAHFPGRAFFVTPFGQFPPTSVSTIPHLSNSVVAVQVPVPGLAGVSKLTFRLGPPVVANEQMANFIYVAQ